MIKESRYCSDVTKKRFSKELVMTKEDNEDFENSAKFWICDNDYIDGDIKVRDHCHITGKYTGFWNREFIISLKLSHKISVVFRSLKNHDSYLIMQKLGIFSLKINVIPNALEKYTSFNNNNK